MRAILPREDEEGERADVRRRIVICALACLCDWASATPVCVPETGQVAADLCSDGADFFSNFSIYSVAGFGEVPQGTPERVVFDLSYLTSAAIRP
jgi:hypothetical protein